MKRFLLTILAIVCFTSVYCQSEVHESLEMESKLLSHSIKYSVYLPDGYDTSQRLYPIVYLLNGFTGDETDWIQFGNMQYTVDREIQEGNITEMVIIMPDGDDRLYMNKTDGTYPYGDMFIKEFIPFVESKYRVRKDKQFRGISGLSMGGAGSLNFALRHHELFGSCAAFSSGILTDDEILDANQQNFENYFARAMTSLKGKKENERLNDDYKKYDLLNLAKTKDEELLKSVKIYFDCGDDDFLSNGNAELHMELKKRNIPHEYRVRDGAHTWSFWRESLPIGLKFISEAMTR